MVLIDLVSHEMNCVVKRQLSEDEQGEEALHVGTQPFCLAEGASDSLRPRPISTLPLRTTCLKNRGRIGLERQHLCLSKQINNEQVIIYSYK